MFEKQRISSQIPNLELAGTSLNSEKNLSLKCLYAVLAYKIFAVLGLRRSVDFSLAVARRGYPLVAVRGLITLTSPAAELGLQGILASAVAALQLSTCSSQALEHRFSSSGFHGLSCSAACGIFPDQGSDLRLLHWQADSLPLSHQGDPWGKKS